MKKLNFYMCLFSMALLDLLYFSWQPYPKSIIKTASDSGASSDIITGIVYFLIFTIVLVIGVRGISGEGERSFFFTRKNIGYIAALIVIQLCMDLAKLIGASLLSEYSAIIYDVFTAVGWVLFAFVLNRMIERMDIDVKWLKIIAGVGVLLLILSVSFDIWDIVQRRAILEKYSSTSQIMESKLLNIQFRYELRNMLLDFGCGVLFWVYIRLISKDSDKNRYGEWSRLVARMIAFTVFCVVVYFAKFIVLPNNAIFPTNFEHSGWTTTYFKPIAWFDLRKTDVFVIYRFDEKIGNVPVYCISNDVVNYNGSDLFDFETDGWYKGSEGTGENGEILFNGWQEQQMDDTLAVIYASQEVVWVNDNETVHISLKDIPAAGENKILTRLCEERIAIGDWRFFEYGYEYLLNYDSDFIVPYIERYAKGEFTDSEVEYSSDYRPEYIQRLAANALGEIGT
jgi:hypothetical protein